VRQACLAVAVLLAFASVIVITAFAGFELRWHGDL
jgi:hypothetical protein